MKTAAEQGFREQGIGKDMFAARFRGGANQCFQIAERVRDSGNHRRTTHAGFDARLIQLAGRFPYEDRGGAPGLEDAGQLMFRVVIVTFTDQPVVSGNLLEQSRSRRIRLPLVMMPRSSPWCRASSSRIARVTSKRRSAGW